MKAIFVIFLVYFLNNAYASNYYFSSISGNDSRTIEEARDPSTPWKTLDKLNSFFAEARPGDSILLKRDETFFGSIVVGKSGSGTLPIVIGAYGVGERPIITSLITINNWKSKGKGIWEAFDSSLGSSLNLVLLNGVEQEMGRYPNSSDANKGYLNYESHVGKTSITDNELSSAINWKGAELVTRPRHWILNRSLITAHSGQTISYITDSPYEPYENYGYFIQNSIKTLDKPGEWYYDPLTEKLSVYFGSKGPGQSVVEAATQQNDLISSKSRSNIVFDNLTLRGTNKSGFFIEGGSNFYIQNCGIIFSGKTAAVIRGHKNVHIENCTMSNSNCNGIQLEFGAVNAVIRNNKIINTAMFAGMMQNGEAIGIAISSNGDGNFIEGNEIRKVGFIGVSFYGSNITIKNNVIDSFSFVKDDGGGIYSHGEVTIATNRKIIGNIVMNGVGAGPGTDIFDKRSVTGIYMDANITDVEILNNTVTKCFQGIFIQSSAGMVIKNNTVYDNVRQMTIKRDKENEPVRNSVITNNIFFSKTLDQWTLYILSSADDISLMGRFDSNYYSRPLDDRITIFNSYVQEGGGTITYNLDLDGWKKRSGQDQHSQKTFKQIVPYKLERRVGVNKFIFGGDFSADNKGVLCTGCTALWANDGKLHGGYLEVTPLSKASGIFVRVDSVIKGKKYILSYSLRGTVDSNMSIGASLNQTNTPYAVVAPLQFRKIETRLTENEIIFTPVSSEKAVNVWLRATGRNTYYVDNFKIYEANARVTDPDDSIRFEYNASPFIKSITLNGNYVDPTGKLYLKKIVLRPYTSAVLLRTGDKVKNLPPTVRIVTPVSDTVYDSFADIFINAKASDADGSIARIEYYNKTTLLEIAEGPEFGIKLDSLAPGDYTITAKAFDNNGLATVSSPVTFKVVQANYRPTITITAPEDSSIVSRDSLVFIQAEARDIDGSVAKVEFYIDSTLIKKVTKLPYNFTLNTLLPGIYKITAKATDNKGGFTISSPVVLIVPPPPTVIITTPGNNAVFSAFSTVLVNAKASKMYGSIEKVEFYNNSNLLLVERRPPFDCILHNIAPGNYTITAVATDDKGQFTISSPVSFSVAPINVAPAVNLTSAENKLLFVTGEDVNLNSVASDPDGTISTVKFYNDTTLLYTATDSPYTYKWRGVPPGIYILKARATDNKGLVTTSAPINITVLPNKPPIVKITTPVNGQSFIKGTTIRLSANAGDPDGTIARVEFYHDTTLISTKNSSPYAVSWKNPSLGKYIITARAYDNIGAVTNSASVTISVVPDTTAAAISATTSPASRNSSQSAISNRPAGTGNPIAGGINTPDQSEVFPKLPDFTLSPNPAINRIRVYFNRANVHQKANIAIQNISGLIIKKYPVVLSGRKMNLDISTLSPGMYVITISGDSFIINKKFLKVN